MSEYVPTWQEDTDDDADEVYMSRERFEAMMDWYKERAELTKHFEELYGKDEPNNG